MTKQDFEKILDEIGVSSDESGVTVINLSIPIEGEGVKRIGFAWESDDPINDDWPKKIELLQEKFGSGSIIESYTCCLWRSVRDAADPT